MLANAIVVPLAVGVGSLTGSRVIALTAVIGWLTIATQLLLNISSLGHARDALLAPALTQLMPVTGGDTSVTMATGIAIVVLIAWALIPTVIGGWRTQTRDA